jgi:hypothetical protein
MLHMVVLPPSLMAPSYRPADVQGPIHKSIEWLDHAGMDIIESVSWTWYCHPHAARQWLTSVVLIRDVHCRETPTNSHDIFDNLATRSVADTPSACCSRYPMFLSMCEKKQSRR